jgi:hypothetical protein
MKHCFGFVIAVGLGLFGEASALAQQPVPPPPPAPAPAAPPAAPPSDKPADAAPAPTGDSVGGQSDPNTPPAPKPAEPTPNAPPAPPPAGETNAPPAPPPVTLPPYLTGGPTPITVLPPIAPQPQPVQQPPSATGPDAPVSPNGKRPAYLRWRGSGLNWNHSVSATALGVGKDYISGDDQQYVQTLSGTFNYFLIEPKDEQGNKRGYQLRVQTSLGFDVELTNSDTTTDKYEKQLRDIPVSFVYGRPLWKNEATDASISLNLNGTFVLPTSAVSRGQGVYLGVNPRAALFFNVPLRGKDADYLKSVFLGVGGGYTHRFTAAETPTNSDLRRLRQTTTGSLIVSDQLTGRSLDTNNVRASAFAFFSEKLFGGDFWASLGVGATYQFVNTFESAGNGCDVVIMTGCTAAQRLDDPLVARVNTDFSISFSYFPNADWGVTVGYDNGAGQLGLDGKWRNPFHSPNAQFSASLAVSVDSIVERIQGSIREEPVIYFGQNRKKPVAPPQSVMNSVVF